MDKTYVTKIVIVLTLCLIPFLGIVVPCTFSVLLSTPESEKAISSQPEPTHTANRWKELNDWYINDSNNERGIAAQIRWTYGETGLRKPSVSDFAYGCVIARLSGYIYPKPHYLSYANTVVELGYTERDEYHIAIAYVLTELDRTTQRNWCNEIVELHNLDPWDGQQVPWSN